MNLFRFYDNDTNLLLLYKADLTFRVTKYESLSNTINSFIFTGAIRIFVMLDLPPSHCVKTGQQEKKFLLRTTPKTAEFLDRLIELTQLSRNTIVQLAMQSFLDEKKNDIQCTDIFHVKEKESSMQFIRIPLSLWDEAEDFVYRYYNYKNRNISLNSLINSSVVALSKLADPLELFDGIRSAAEQSSRGDMPLHPQLKEQLEQLAQANGTTLHEEIHLRLMQSLETCTQPHYEAWA